MVWKLVFQSMLMLLMFQLAAAPPPIAKSGCRDRCGDISIPYPFGIGKDCYMNESFAIECNETVSRPARAFISAINMEVLNISAKRAAATVKAPILSSNCSGRENGVPLNLSGTPFVFSSYYNVFVAVGCNTEALMSGTSHTLVGCVSPCSDVESKNFCVASPLSLLQVFNTKLEATDDREGCKLAFVVNQTWFESNISDPFTVQHRDYVPAELGWTMDGDMYDQSVICLGFWNKSFGSECACYRGYEGIPYRELGCKDVDECKEESKHDCRGLLKCVNTPGSFKCEINKLYIALIVSKSSCTYGKAWLPRSLWKHQHSKGTTKDCYLDESFEIVCDETVNLPRVFIRKTNMEVRNIEEGAAAVVRGPIMSSNICSGRQSGPPVNLEGNPYLGCVSKVTV